MVTDEQVKLLMSLLKQGIVQVTAAAKAGMSERTARKYVRSGATPSEAKVPHTWRTRSDPFAEVWPEIEALLRQDAGLQAKTVWEELNRRHAGRFSAGQLRTLQRRFLAWRLKAGPDREVFFPQTHVPGEQGQSDFTDMRELEVVIAGEPFAHLLYHFVLTYSNWESVSICPSESFEALSAGMQTAFWRLGGVPIEHRTDNLSAATHELAESRGRDFTERYRELIDHYGLRASRNFPGNAHENGDVESANGRLKSAIDQRLATARIASVRLARSVRRLPRRLRADAQCHPSRTDRGGTPASAAAAGAAIAGVSRVLRDGVARERRARAQALLLGVLAPDRASTARAVTRRHRGAASPRRARRA